MGIKLDNYTVREAIRQVEAGLDRNILYTIEQVSMQMLLDAQKDSVLKETLDALHLTIIGEKEILQAVGGADLQKVREIEGKDFLCEFLKMTERNKKSIFLLGKTEADINEMKETLLVGFPGLEIAGEYATDQCTGDLEAVINDMNAMTPDVILSLIPSPEQEYFFREHKEKINANIWYGLGTSDIRRKKRGLKGFWLGRLQMNRLKSSMNKYKKNK